ncbi:hypothetical protein A3C23_05550 [Candidatus Roizmanbacteria bacterium RIFCSPHIGHO2_02_FULL_37_13b]|nr:MAG: hypothetical protein A3C23_05550 [Candidatus Roizmanbacteria bacterium RIFCSPHIGHO2_02_FULL_37_13b]
MKKNQYLLIGIIITLLLIKVNAFTYAQNLSPTEKITSISPSESPKTTLKPTPTTKEDENIQTLKDKIATKVAELREKNRTIIIGYLQKNDNNTLLVKDEKEIEYKITVDSDLTKIYTITGNAQKEIKLKDLINSSYLIISGTKIDDSISANIIYVDKQYFVASGKIIEVNTDDKTIGVLTTDKEQYILDVETKTKQAILNVKTLDSQKGGFSKIKVGDTLHFVAMRLKDEKTGRNKAIRLLLVPQEFFNTK